MGKTTCAFYEALEEQGGDDGTGERRFPDVAQVGDTAFKLRIISGPERQSPNRITDFRRYLRQRGGERVVIAKESRNIGPQSDAGGAGERSEHEHVVGPFLVCKRDGVGEDKPAFGIRVANLNRGPRARLQNVTRPERVAGYAVLRCRDQDAQPHAELLAHDHVAEG